MYLIKTVKDLETAKLLGVELTKWHKEDEIL